MKKFIIGSVVFMVFMSANLLAEIVPVLTLKGYDKFVKAPAGVVVNKHDVIYMDYCLTIPDDVYFGISHWQAVNAPVDSIANETDYYVGIEKPITTNVFGLVEAKYWDRTKQFEGPANDVWVVRERIRTDLVATKQCIDKITGLATKVTPFMEFHEFFPGRDSTFAGGMISSAGCTAGIKTDDGSNWKWTAEPVIGYDDGIFKKDTALLYRFRTAISWQADKKLQVTLLEYSHIELSGNRDDRRSVSYVGTGLIWYP